MAGCFLAASSAITTSSRGFYCPPAPEGAPCVRRPLTPSARASLGPSTRCWLELAYDEQLRTRLELEHVHQRENPRHPAQCKARLNPRTRHVLSVCLCVIAGREMVDVSKTSYRETAKRRGKEGQPYLRPDAVPGCTTVTLCRSGSPPHRQGVRSWFRVLSLVLSLPRTSAMGTRLLARSL